MSTNEQLVLRAEQAAAQIAADKAEIQRIEIKLDNVQAPAIASAKEDIKQALIEKGQSIDDNVPFSEYGNKVRAIDDGGIDTSDATVTEDDILNGKIAYGSSGKVTGTIPTVTATLTDNVTTVPKGHIAEAQTLVVQEASAPTTSENVVTINKGYQASQQEITVGMAKEASTITPTTSDITIAKGTYLSGDQTIKGDANLTADNIKEGVSIFGVEGSHKGSVVAGYFVNTDGEITFKALDGTTENVQEISIVDTGVEEPDYNKCSVGGMDFYKCASVDTTNKTWTGYLAVLTDGVYTFEENVTDGLTYGDAYTPKVNEIYNSIANMQISQVWTGIPTDGLVCYIPLSSTINATTGQSVSAIGSSFSFGVVDSIPCVTLSDQSYLQVYDDDQFPHGNSPWTFSVWMKHTGEVGPNGDAHAVAYGESSANRGVFLGVHSDHALYTAIHSTYERNTELSSHTQWRHLAFSFDGNNVKTWVDGTLNLSAEVPPVDIGSPYLRIGNHMSDDNFYFTGSLAAFRLYDYALSDNEIERLASEFVITR